MREEVAGTHQGREVGKDGEVQSTCRVCRAKPKPDESASVPEGMDVVVEAD